MGKERVVVVTDTVSDLPFEFALKNGVDGIAPLSVTFNPRNPQKTFLDRVTISPAEFFTRLKTSSFFPTTAAPAPGRFEEIYLSAMDKKRTGKVLSIHLPPPPISETINIARQTLAKLRQEKVKPELKQFAVVDSGQLSLGLGIAALKAAELSQKGKNLPEIVDEIKRILPRIYTFGLLPTLEYARRGGRLSLVKYMLGAVLKIVPIIEIHNGEIKAIANPRTKEKAINEFIKHLRGLAQNYGFFAEVAIVHGDALSDANRIHQVIKDLSRVGLVKKDWGVFEMGPVLGAHGGPGTIGVSILFPPKISL